MKNILAIIGGGFLVYWLLTNASRHVTNNLSLVKASLQVGAIELQGIPLKIALHISNNTQFALPLDAFKGFLSDGSHELAPVIVNHSVIIEPKQTSIITKPGIVNYKNRKHFELWRGMTTLEGYICLSPKRRSEISKLIISLKREKWSELKRAEVCFIKANPGSGKSYLVECLAKHLDLKIIQFNLSQVHTKTQLINCFDAISTMQSENRQKPLLIFFDEMNSLIEASIPYSPFLAPLEDGYYLRNNNKFKLSPSIWVFVGTDLKKDEANKASDFISRLTLPIVNLKPPENASISDDVKELELLEKIYYSVSFIRRTFKEVIEISEGALEIFSRINSNASPRVIRKFIESIEHIPYEKVNVECLLKTIKRYDKAFIADLFETTNNFEIIEDGANVIIYDTPDNKI